VATGKVIRTIPAQQTAISCLAISPDGKFVATGAADPLGHIWNAATGEKVGSFLNASTTTRALAFSPDSNRLAVDAKQEVRVFDIAAKKQLCNLVGHSGPPLTMAFSPDGKQLVTGTKLASAKTGEFIVWDLETGKAQATINFHTTGVVAALFTPDGKQIITSGAASDRLIAFWSPAAQPVPGPPLPMPPPDRLPAMVDQGPPAGVPVIKPRLSFAGRVMYGGQALLFDPEGKTLIFPTTNGIVRRDPVTGNENGAAIPREPAKQVVSLARSADGKLLAISDTTDTARLWDLENGKELKEFPHKNAGGAIVTISPDGKLLATARNEIRLWDAETGKETATWRPAGLVHHLAFSPDNKLLACTSWSERVQIWDLTGKEVLSLEGHFGSVKCLAFSPDGKRLATGSMDQTARLWDLETGKELQTFRGHADEVHSVAFSPDGKRLLCGVGSGIWKARKWPYAHVWDLETGKRLAVLVGHAVGIGPVAWSPNGKTVATSGHDGMVKVWDVDEALKSVGKE
jgi:WD40 repeat protein